MAANALDKYMYTGSPGTATTLSSPGYTTGVSTSITVGTTASFSTLTGQIFAIDTVEVVTINGVAEEVQVAGTYCVFSGVVTNGTTIANLTLEYGTAQSYAAGALTRVYIPVSSLWTERLIEGLTAEHNQLDGTHKNITSTNATLTNATITNPTFTNAPDVPDTVDPLIRASETIFDFVASGCVWSGDAYASTRVASMTAGVVYIGGVRVPVSAVTSRTFTASKDVYIDVGADGTVDYTDGTTNAASPALAASHVRLGIIVVGASSIAAATSVNQGQETMVLPIASSIPYAVTDSLGNLICPRDPARKILGYRQIIADVAGSGSAVQQITGLTCPVIVPTSRKIKITTQANVWHGTTSTNPQIWDGTVGSGTLLITIVLLANQGCSVVTFATPSSASKTYNAGNSATSGNAGAYALTTLPAYIMVELV